MSSPITALRGEYLDPSAFRFARNQREAGIEHLEWEGRIKPLRPICNDIVLALGGFLVAILCFFL
jgi:hypothetical protein